MNKLLTVFGGVQFLFSIRVLPGSSLVNFDWTDVSF